MTPFCRKINYSSVNEDGRSEIRALKMGAADRVLCITGSGARPLDLLTENPAEIVAVDFNPCQNHLLELKMRAIESLAYEDFLGFIGVRPSGKRVRVYKELRDGLSDGAGGFWDGKLRMIKKGIIYQGGWEKYFKSMAILFGLVRADLLRAIFSCRTIGRQARLWSEAWDSPEWRMFLRFVSRRAVWKYAFRDPGFYQYVPEDFSIYGYHERKFEHAFKNVLLRESPYAALLFLGRLADALPPHLQERHYETLRKNLHKVRIVTGSLGDILDGGVESFDKFSLSDFSSYTDKREYRRIWRGVIKSAAPGARACERQYLVKRDVPWDVQDCVRRENELEKDLERTDNSLFFSFVVAEIGDRRR